MKLLNLLTTIPEIYSDALVSSHDSNFGDAILISNKYFDPISSEENLFPILRSFNSYAFLFAKGIRSKMIMYSSTVFSPGHHAVNVFSDSKFKNINCPIEIALLHHYRRGIMFQFNQSFHQEILPNMLRWNHLLFNSPILKTLKKRFKT